MRKGGNTSRSGGSGKSSGRRSSRSDSPRGKGTSAFSKSDSKSKPPRKSTKFSGPDEKPPRFSKSKPTSKFSKPDSRSDERPSRYSKPAGGKFSSRKDSSEDASPRRSSKFSGPDEKPSRFSKSAGPSKFSKSDTRSDERPSRYSKPTGGKFSSDKDSSKRSSKFSRPDEKPPRVSKSTGPSKFSKSDSRSDERPSRYSKPVSGKFSSDKDSPKRPTSRTSSKFSGSDEKRPRYASSAKRVGKSTSDKSKGGERERESRPEYKDALQTGTEKIRLNKYISNSGVCSRREADELILMGVVSVNDVAITELGYKVNPGDVVKYEGRKLTAEKPVYVLMNKPKGFLTTTKDPQERNTVMHIIANVVKERVYPVGRLDRNTTGLLLLTNDGDLAEKLSHPSYNVKKIYKVELDKPLTRNDYLQIMEGIQLPEGRAMVDDLAIVSDDSKTVGIELHIGWNRVVRRIFEALNYTVIKLDRSVYAGLDKKELPRGEWRFLKKEEVIKLKHFK